ncbi:MAG: sulfite exporter TauE/SafE family protein [Ilumatobacteraceae bacterium]
MFTTEALLIGALASFVVGLSKTGLPGSGLLAIPLFAMVFDGRLIPGATLPILLVADLFAIAWYRRHTRWDLLRPLVGWVGVGYAAGIAFFIAVGSATRAIEVMLGIIVIVIVTLQAWRMIRRVGATPTSRTATAAYGTSGGFTTFVANAAGPIMNTYLIGLGLPKHELVGTSAWFYFAVNLGKVPFYVALGELTSGGRFFTVDGLVFDVIMVPAIVVGVISGRALFHRIPQQVFLTAVLVMSAAGAVRLLW